MAKVEIWVPLIGNDRDGYDPDMPPEYETDRMSFDVDDTTTQDMDTGAVLTSRYNLIVDESELPKIREHLHAKHEDYILYGDGPEKDCLLVDMTRALRDKALGRDRDAAADALFNSIPNMISATEPRKRMVKEVLLQAVARGVSAGAAEAMRFLLQQSDTGNATRGPRWCD